MKYILSLFTLIIVLASCGQNQDKVDQAKQELLQQWQADQTQQTVENTSWESDISEQWDNTNQNDSYVEVRDVSDIQYISVNTINSQESIDGELQITWKTLDDVTTISVRFSNEESDYPVDNYTLQTFKSGDSTFLYNASSKSKVLDYGENVYLITATSSTWEKSQTEVTINIPKTLTENIKQSESQLAGSSQELVVWDLPTSSRYWEPIKVWESSFTYSQIKSLEVKKEVLPTVSCETLGDFLKEKMNTWYYWNTCRDIVEDEWIRFNLIRLDGDAYIYERTYIDFKNGYYGTYELETGEWVSTETIQEKNKELWEKEFPNTQIVDTLMRDILQS